MSRFGKLTHVLWHCQYHIVWTPKLRIRKETLMHRGLNWLFTKKNGTEKPNKRPFLGYSNLKIRSTATARRG